MSIKSLFCPICRGLSESSIDELLSNAAESRFNVGRKIYLQGSDFKGVFVVKSGGIRLSSDNDEGREFVVETKGPGETFGVTGYSSQAYLDTATALSKSSCVYISKSLLNRLLKNIEFSSAFIEELNRWLLAYFERFKLLSYLNAKKRVELFFSGESDQKGLELTPKKHEIASSLGLRPETLSRILRQLEGEGQVVTRFGKVLWVGQSHN